MMKGMTWWRWITLPLWGPMLLAVTMISAIMLCVGCPDEVYEDTSRGLLDG